jgi:thiol-disulfide isomerase/thioredoxin
MPSTTYIKLCIAILLAMSSLFTKAQTPDTKPLDIKFTALDGRKVDLSKMKGKVVLIDFWATWCGPCIKEIPHLKEMYNKYRGEGFEVVSISLDDGAARDRVEAIIKNKGVTWPIGFEGRPFNESTYAREYNIKQLPTVWLLDKNGKIVDTDARGERLEPLIRQCLGLNN